MFDLSNLRAADTADLIIRHPVTGEATDWVWTIAGPGHPTTLAFQEKAQRKRMEEDRQRRQAQINGRKWKEEQRDPDELRQENIESIAVRVVGFNEAVLDGAKVEYSPAAVTKILMDPDFGWLLGQVVDFLTDDASFFGNSERPSSPSPSTQPG